MLMESLKKPSQIQTLIGAQRSTWLINQGEVSDPVQISVPLIPKLLLMLILYHYYEISLIKSMGQ